MPIFGLTIFTGAFLLFLVQPLIARFILPWFGGGPSVWTTCMLFFQMLLLGGYGYAHWNIRRFAPRRQVMVHLGLLVAALLLLPITPGDYWKPPDGAVPMGRILLLLLACLGLPYLVLSATGPLMQAWFIQAYPGVSPYRLYALSNAGSLLALVSYPFVVEPNLSRQAQAGWWSIGLGLFAALAAWCGRLVWKRAATGATRSSEDSSAEIPRQDFQAFSGDILPPAPKTVAAENCGAADCAPDEPEPMGRSAALESPASEGSSKGKWFWFALPACASALLLAVTNKICQDIVVIPFLWVLPLSLYLLSFMVSFDSPRWYGRPFWIPLLVLALGAVLWMMLGDELTLPSLAVLRPIHWLLAQADDLTFFTTIAIYLGALFVCCMVCHGEVYRLRPAARQLTAYYLVISAGGAFGGLFVAVLSPLVFKNYFELHAGLLTTGLVIAALFFVDDRSPLRHGRRAWAWVLVVLAVLGLGAGLYHDAAYSVRGTVEISRSFYGVLKVKENYANTPEAHEFTLQHGSTTHGLQYVAADKRRKPTSYYTRTSGIGRLMENFPRPTRRVGVVGLGTGTMAAWTKAGDYLRIYEINAEVCRLARTRFSYIVDTPAKVEVVLGDARLSMEREPDQQLDILVLDAFSGDAIPAHLLTREAFDIYRRHLRADGVIAVHISNRYLDLEPIVVRIAKYLAFRAAVIHDGGDSSDDGDEDGESGYSTDWVLLTRNEAFLALPSIAQATATPRDYSPKISLWTDEENSLFRILVLDKDGWLGRLRKLLP